MTSREVLKKLKEAGSGLKKVLKGQKPSRHEAKAIATFAVEIGAAAALAVTGAGATGGWPRSPTPSISDTWRSTPTGWEANSKSAGL